MIGMPAMGLFGIVARVGVHHVVGADDDGDVGVRDVGIDLLQFVELRVGNVGFGEQHVHVAGHAAGDGMDGVLHGDAALFEHFGQFAHDVLRLRGGHAVAGDEDHLARVGELHGRVSSADLAHLPPAWLRRVRR